MEVGLKSNRFIVEPKNLLLYISFALSLTLFLGYIDEGYYSFKFLQDPGNIFVLSIYSLVFLIYQLLIDAFTLRKRVGMKKGLLTIVIFFVSLFLFILLWMIINTTVHN